MLYIVSAVIKLKYVRWIRSKIEICVTDFEISQSKHLPRGKTHAILDYPEVFGRCQPKECIMPRLNHIWNRRGWHPRVSEQPCTSSGNSCTAGFWSASIKLRFRPIFKYWCNKKLELSRLNTVMHGFYYQSVLEKLIQRNCVPYAVYSWN